MRRFIGGWGSQIVYGVLVICNNYFILLLSCRSELINYSGDLMTPPDQRGKSTTILSKKGGKTIKGGRRTGKYADDDDSSDDNDW